MTAADPKADSEYKVGYKRPPKETQFKSGQRANPNGRPRGSRNTKAIVGAVLNKRVPVRRGNRMTRVPMIEAIAETFALKAVEGDRHAAGVLINLGAKSGVFSPPQEDSPASIEKATTCRPSDLLVESVDPNVLSEDEKIELSKLAELIDLGGDVMALGDDDLLRFKQLVKRGRGGGDMPGANNGLGAST